MSCVALSSAGLHSTHSDNACHSLPQPTLVRGSGQATTSSGGCHVGQIVMARGDHKGIHGAVCGAQAEVVMQVTGVVRGESELRRLLGRVLAKHNELEILLSYPCPSRQ